MKVLIAGAGPGGLTAALCLARAGIECEVFESVARIRQLGVGLICCPTVFES
jgi:2-polyprenyl-6-methoxyphenol hydroxylase-like FAD-dependent oxidoreductase